jgi:putative transposase
VEQNPVRACLVRKAENYTWASAAAHCHFRRDEFITSNARWWAQCEEMGDWSRWLGEGDEPEKLTALRRNIDKGLPCGSGRFLKKSEQKVGRVLQYRPLGRPKNQGHE